MASVKILLLVAAFAAIAFVPSAEANVLTKREIPDIFRFFTSASQSATGFIGGAFTSAGKLGQEVGSSITKFASITQGAAKPAIPAKPSEEAAKPAVPAKPSEEASKPAIPAKPSQDAAKPADPANPLKDAFKLATSADPLKDASKLATSAISTASAAASAISAASASAMPAPPKEEKTVPKP